MVQIAKMIIITLKTGELYKLYIPKGYQKKIFYASISK
jgi:hypothetical protein